jgi:hypothetical protein
VYECTVPDLPVADQKMLLNLWHSFIKSLSGYARKNCRAYFYATCSSSTCPKNNTLKKKSRVGLYNPPSGSLCLTFREMAESSHEQSARATILNSNRPKSQQIAA